MITRAMILGGGLLLFSNYAIADQVSPCVEIARTLGINRLNYLDSDQRAAVTQADMCSETYSTASSDKKAQIAASYELFSGNASGSDAEITQAQSENCQGHYGSYWRRGLTTTDEQTVSSEGAAVVTECLKLTAASILPNLLVVNEGKLVELTAQFRPDRPGKLIVTRLGPVDLKTNSCTITKPDGSTSAAKLVSDTKTTLTEQESVTISCARAAHPVVRSGMNATCTDETIFTVATNGPTTFLTIPRVCSESIQKSTADKLAQQLDALQQSYKALKDQVGANAQADSKLVNDTTGPLSSKITELENDLTGKVPFVIKWFPHQDACLNQGGRPLASCATIDANDKFVFVPAP